MNKSDVNDTSDCLSTESSETVLAPGEVILGRLLGFDEVGSPLVTYPQVPEGKPQRAVSTLPISHQHVGRQVALLFNGGDLCKPVIMGIIHSPLEALLQSDSGKEEDPVATKGADLDSKRLVDANARNSAATFDDTVCVDGKKIHIEGQEEVVISCGEASITLTKDGKVMIRGKYLLSRSSGVNRILGGSVQVN